MKKCEYCGKQGAPLGGINISKHQLIDFFIHKNTIECKLRGKKDFDVYIAIRFCPMCGKSLREQPNVVYRIFKWN